MVARGNRLADQTARAVATQSAQSIPLLNIQEGQPAGDPLPYSPEDHELAKKMGASWDPEKQAYALQDKLIMPTSHTRYMLRFLHALTHLSKNKMKALLADETSRAVLLNQDRVLQQVTSDCPACAQVNPGKAHLQRGARQRGHRPGIHWETDFTEVKPGLYGYRYLLVFVDTFSRWIEAFPTKKETANMVVKKMLEEIFPRYGMPQVLGSDNGPAFVSQVSQKVARLLGIDWKLHCAYRPQSSGQVERANRTIKETLTKLTLATGTRDWVLLLPLALYWARNTPGPHGLTPFEILYGGPPPILNFLHPDISSFATSPTLEAHLQALQLVQKEVWKPLAQAYQEQLSRPVVPHPFQIGDSVWVRRHQAKNLEPRWKGPYTVLLTTPTALKVDGIAAWIHASHVKAAVRETESAEATSWTVRRTQNPLKIRLSRGLPSPSSLP
ncbi:hypothetical protein STEG23_004263 [Scotinomys teguina]